MNRKVLLFFLIFVICFSVLAFADDNNDSRQEPELIEEELYNNLRITSTDANGFHGVLLGLIGDYEPIVKDYTYQNTQGYWTHTVEIQPDWSWIASCAVFCLVFFCFMLFIGKLFTR